MQFYFSAAVEYERIKKKWTQTLNHNWGHFNDIHSKALRLDLKNKFKKDDSLTYNVSHPHPVTSFA